MSDNSRASVKRKNRNKGESPCASPGVSSKSIKSTKSKKVRKVDKSSRARKAGKVATPARSPSRENSGRSDVKTESKTSKKVDPEVLKAIKDGRESFIHVNRRGAKMTTFAFPPGRIYKHGTDPRTVPIVPTTKMKDEMRAMNQRSGRKKSKQRKYLAEKTSSTNTADKSSASRKKSRKSRVGRKKNTPIPPK